MSTADSSHPSPPKSNPTFRADIEGLRGIAVLLVVLYHAGVVGFTGGYVGVDVFFTLSGYLITGLLVSEVEGTGHIDLLNFYARRARRLLPAMGVLLLAVMAFAFTFYAPLEQGDIAKTALATAAYVSNFYFGLEATDYLAAEAETNPLLHSWSLSVEEQFYLFWPLLIFVALRGFRLRHADTGLGSAASRTRLTWVMTGVALLSFGLTLYLMRSGRQHWAFFSSPTRAWEFAVGGIGVLLPRLAIRLRTRPFVLSPQFTQATAWVGLGGILAAGFFYDARTPFPGFAALLPTLSTVMVLRAATTQASSTMLGRLLGCTLLQQAGRLSYSWYLWHWPVLVFAEGLFGKMPLWVRMGLLLLSLALAELSYRLVENPVRHHRALARRPTYGLALAVTLTVLGVGMSLGWRKISYDASQTPDQMAFAHAKDDRIRNCVSKLTSTDLKECVLGDSTASTTMLLFGDSHADHWIPALSLVAREQGLRLVTLTHAGCPYLDIPRWNDNLGRAFWECDVWRDKAILRIGELNPALVISSSSTTSYTFTDEQWLQETERFYSRITTLAGRVVHLHDVPRPESDVPNCLARSAWSDRGEQDCSFALNHSDVHIRTLQTRAIGNVPGVYQIDLTEHFCSDDGTCRVRDGDVVMYHDAHHLTSTFAVSLAPVLSGSLSAILASDTDLRSTPVTEISN